MPIVRCKGNYIFFRDYAKFCIWLFKLINKQSTSNVYKKQLLNNVHALLLSLSSNEPMAKTTPDSKKIYDAYDDREIRDEASTVPFNSVVDGNVTLITHQERRKNALSYLYSQIDLLLKAQNKVSILEVGCGNLLNAVEVKRKYGENIEYSGIDISGRRISIGFDYFFTQLDAKKFYEMSITEKTNFNSNSFDIVFSMHCLEQIAYDTKCALSEMYRICKHYIVMIEPIFENGSFLQRTYLMRSDHTRILLKSINDLGYNIETNKACYMQPGMENQSSVLIIKKA